MKANKKITSLFFFILICGIVSSCTTTKNYKLIQQSLVESAAIKAATEFKVKPIDFSYIKPLDLGYANVEEWKVDIEPVSKAFEDAFLELCDQTSQYKQQKELYGAFFSSKTNIFNKKIIIIKKDEPVYAGIVVDIAVKEIVLKWNWFSEEPDEYECDISFTDAVNGQKIFSGVVKVNSRDLGAERFNVGRYKVSFSGRMQSAAYNMAEMLTEIMANGKLSPK